MIQIKRSNVTSTPSSLAEGELAYSLVSKNLFIGTAGGSNIEVIGGNTDHVKLAGIEAGAQVNTVTSVAGKTGTVTLALTDLTDYSVSNFVHTTGTESIGGDKTFSNNVIVTGNLTVNGTVTTVNSTTVSIADNIVELNSGVTGTPSLDAGLGIIRGSSDTAFLLWNETTDKWGVKLGTGSHTAFSLAGHTHTASEITDFSTAVGSLITTATGSLTLVGLSDVNVTSPTNNQILKYDSATGKWINGTSSGGGASTFTSLTDAPSSYSGAGGYFVKVNSGATALEFVSGVAWSAIGSTPTTLSGYGITDALSNTATIDGGSF
jgi:hypothetical protein